MRALFLVIGAVFLCALTSCNECGPASDGYTFEQGSQRIGDREIRIVLYSSGAELKAAYAALPNGRQLGPSEDLQAYSAITNNTCTIHMIDPAAHYNPEFAGHELTHCLYGEFHPSQNDR